MQNPRSEYLILKHCAVQWARHITSVMPGDGASRPAFSAFIRGVDGAVDTELARLLGYADAAAIPPQVRAECGLPENKGGLNIPTLNTIAPIAYVASVIKSGALLESHSPSLHSHLMRCVLGDDPLGIRSAVSRVMEHHDWHDGTTRRGKAPYVMPSNIMRLLTEACPRELDLKRNLDSRVHHIVTDAYEARVLWAPDKAAAADAQHHKARFASASGKMASAWLNIPPKAERFNTAPALFPGHLFHIALRLRMGLPMPEYCRGGVCRCRQKKAGTQRRERAEWDRFGRHLSGQCGHGGWRIKRHDDVARVVMRYLRAAGLRATDRCVDVYPACPSVTAGEAKRGLRTTRLIPDIVATDCYGTTTVFDVMISCVSGSSKAATQPLWAAKQAESVKRRKYDDFKTKCREAGVVDASLDLTVVPLTFENIGAAGPSAQEFFRGVRRHFSTQVLDLEDQSAEAYFQSFWTHNISVALMRGTADIIYNVPRGESVPARYRRPLKEEQHRMSAANAPGTRRPARGRPRRAASPAPLSSSDPPDSSSDDASLDDGYATASTASVGDSSPRPV